MNCNQAVENGDPIEFCVFTWRKVQKYVPSRVRFPVLVEVAPEPIVPGVSTVPMSLQEVFKRALIPIVDTERVS